jgi:hypothetical protein
LPAAFPEGRFETEPEGFDVDEPDGRDDEPDETAGDLRFEVLLEDLCTEVEREGPEEVRDAPFLVCANA